MTLGSGIESNAQQIMVQLKGIGFVMVFAPVMTFLILSALKLVFGSLRVSDEEEAEGLDLAEHQETAYSLSSGSSISPAAAAAGHAHMAIGAAEGKLAWAGIRPGARSAPGAPPER